MPSHRRPSPVLVPSSGFAGFRFPPDVILLAVRLYLRFALSYRDVEELLAERGMEVDHVSVYRWVQRFTPIFADAARARVASHMRCKSGRAQAPRESVYAAAVTVPVDSLGISSTVVGLNS
jgi:hypothetical protein